MHRCQCMKFSRIIARRGEEMAHFNFAMLLHSKTSCGTTKNAQMPMAHFLILLKCYVAIAKDFRFAAEVLFLNHWGVRFPGPGGAANKDCSGVMAKYCFVPVFPDPQVASMWTVSPSTVWPRSRCGWRWGARSSRCPPASKADCKRRYTCRRRPCRYETGCRAGG